MVQGVEGWGWVGGVSFWSNPDLSCFVFRSISYRIFLSCSYTLHSKVNFLKAQKIAFVDIISCQNTTFRISYSFVLLAL